MYGALSSLKYLHEKALAAKAREGIAEAVSESDLSMIEQDTLDAFDRIPASYFDDEEVT